MLGCHSPASLQASLHPGRAAELGKGGFPPLPLQGTPQCKWHSFHQPPSAQKEREEEKRAPHRLSTASKSSQGTQTASLLCAPTPQPPHPKQHSPPISEPPAPHKATSQKATCTAEPSSMAKLSQRPLGACHCPSPGCLPAPRTPRGTFCRSSLLRTLPQRRAPVLGGRFPSDSSTPRSDRSPTGPGLPSGCTSTSVIATTNASAPGRRDQGPGGWLGLG